MKIIIDIPDNKYHTILNHAEEILDASSFIEPKYLYLAVINGTLLFSNPHGRLIDVDELEDCKEIMTTISGESKYAVRMDDVRNMSTIIEADKEE